MVGGVERDGDARADVDRQLGAQPRLHVEQLAQALAVDELHHDGLAALVLEDVVDGDDVRVGQAGDGDGLAAEPLGDDGVGGQARLEPLEGDLAVERDVGGQPHLGHPALGEPPLEPVAPGEHDRLVAARRARARSGRGGRRRHSAAGTLVAQAAGNLGRVAVRRRGRSVDGRSGRSWNATPIVPRPAWVPITGPIWPTTISPAANGRSWSTNASTSLQSAWSTARCSMRPSNEATLSIEEREGLGAGALLAVLLDDPVGDLDDRLDRQRGGQQRLGVADASALLQVLERVEGAEHPGARRRARAAWRSMASRSSPAAAALGAGQGDRAEAERDRAAVDDAHVDAVGGDGAGGQLGALHRRRQRAGERDDDDAGRRPGRRGAGRPARSVPVTVPPSTAAPATPRSGPRTRPSSAPPGRSSSSSPKRMLSGTISMPHCSDEVVGEVAGAVGDDADRPRIGGLTDRSRRPETLSAPTSSVGRARRGLGGVGETVSASGTAGLSTSPSSASALAAPAAEVPVPPRDEHEHGAAGDDLAEAGERVDAGRQHDRGRRPSGRASA